ncbi:MAG: phosphoribosylamine--glycine ligase [Chloroflexi bacterium]|nr:phosphoribosylamine--glycine ligase [Chloroflexota bacterium]
MNILIVGSGAREHALAWKIRQSPRVENLFAAPGNAGTAFIAQNLSIDTGDFQALSRATQEHAIDLTVVGPEIPLANGIADYFQEHSLPIFGPTKAAAKIEASKVFAKELMMKYGIPTAMARIFTSYTDAKRYVELSPLPLVVKADGLAAGKGVTVAKTREEALEALSECMEKKVFGESGERVLIEECLQGQEVSVFAFTDGENLSSIVAACDYKRAWDGDRGPNTGGMGSYSPPGFWSMELEERILKEIMEPVIAAMAKEGAPFQGVLYGGLMITREGPKVIEFNARLGDPETQVIIPRLKSDPVEVMLSVLSGKLRKTPLEWSNEASVGVVIASGGYPGSYGRGYPIQGLDTLEEEVLVFHAGTKLALDTTSGKTRIVSDGGRVVTVVALGEALAEARERVYSNIGSIHFQDSFYRKDIAEGVTWS